MTGRRKTTEERAAINRANIEKRWAPYREQRLREGIPMTRELEDGRAPRFLDPDTEPLWLQDALERGLVTPGMSRTAHRLLAKRLADAAVQEEIENADKPARAPEDVNAAVLIIFFENEGERWRRRATRDRGMAMRHDLLAHEADRNLEQAMRDAEEIGK